MASLFLLRDGFSLLKQVLPQLAAAGNFA
ncbi:Protein of unknown function [Lactobacillus delbrueckii subsp. bulgaricus]|nr:Protein of unknown function [Lactobacillus delbrueckii subsp. bulgaricus]